MKETKKTSEFEWRCQGCSSLLGTGRQGRLFISFAGGQYATQLPVEAVCSRCSCYNSTIFLVAR